MKIKVGDISLFVEVVGTKLKVEDGAIVERPTIVFLHGGPAWDHMLMLKDFLPLEDVGQLIFYDHRGLGRSDAATSESWTLDQWAADLARLIEALDLGRPIIFGQSFGGMVAQRFAINHPDAYSALILSATAARFNLPEVEENFRALGGEALGTLARSFFTAADPVARDRFLVEGFPFYTQSKVQIGASTPFVPDVLDHFFSAAGDAHRFDHRSQLKRVDKPVLILAGEDDPVTTAEAARELAAAFPPESVQLEILQRCGHGPARDRPDATLPIIGAFVDGVAQSGSDPSHRGNVPRPDAMRAS